MAAITMDMIKTLREKTGVGVGDCKKALEEAGGDMNAAVENLRKSGIAKAEKKASRTTKEGLIFSNVTAGVGALVEIVCETDFVAKNERFVAYGKDLAKRVAGMAGEGDLTAAIQKDEQTAVIDLINAIGENIQIRRVLRWTAKDAGRVVFYDHHNKSKIVVMVELAGEGVADNAVCMHIAAFSPRYIKPDQVSADVVAKEKEIAAAQIQDKPANMIEKIVMGKISKWYTEVCLLQQPWLLDDKTCLAKTAPKLEVRRMLRWQVGEELASA